MFVCCHVHIRKRVIACACAHSLDSAVVACQVFLRHLCAFASVCRMGKAAEPRPEDCSEGREHGKALIQRPRYVKEGAWDPDHWLTFTRITGRQTYPSGSRSKGLHSFREIQVARVLYIYKINIGQLDCSKARPAGTDQQNLKLLFSQKSDDELKFAFSRNDRMNEGSRPLNSHLQIFDKGKHSLVSSSSQATPSERFEEGSSRWHL